MDLTNMVDEKKIINATLNFLNRQRSSNTFLVESFSGSSNFFYNPADGTFSERSFGYLQSQCFIYDLSLCIIAYSLGKDFESAKRILSILEKNFYIGKEGKIGLFNSYRTDRYANDTEVLVMGIDGDRMHAGPNIWVGLAAYQYMVLSKDKSFYPLCLEIIKWAIHQLHHRVLVDGSRGGISMGYGWGHDWQKIYSSENNIDYFALLNLVENDYSNNELSGIIRSSALRLIEVQEEKRSVGQWLVHEVYDKNLGLLYAGHNQTGLDKTKALDTATFSILGIGPEKLFNLGINPDRLIDSAEKFLKVETTIKEQKIEGFDFTDTEGHGQSRPAAIWLEGTYQMILAYQQMADFYQNNLVECKKYQDKYTKLLQNIETFIEIGDCEHQVPSYTTLNPKEDEIIMTFKGDWEIQRGLEHKRVPSIASTVWRQLAAMKFNPMMSSSKALL